MPPRKTKAAEQTPPAFLTGDQGARESQVASAIERVEALADQIDLGQDGERVVANATAWLLELFKSRPKPWSELSQAEQRDVAAALEHNAKELVRHLVEAIARNGREPIRCLLVGFTDKGDDIKAELKVKPHSLEEAEAAVVGLHRARGKHVLITVASADDYAGVPASDQSQPDQAGLGFEAGNDEHPADDSDLVEAAGGARLDEHVAAELAQTGKQMLVPNHGLCEIRVSLSTGMVEAKPPGEDGFNIDVREATSVELAAERDRQADFSDERAEAWADEPIVAEPQ